MGFSSWLIENWTESREYRRLVKDVKHCEEDVLKLKQEIARVEQGELPPDSSPYFIAPVLTRMPTSLWIARREGIKQTPDIETAYRREMQKIWLAFYRDGKPYIESDAGLGRTLPGREQALHKAREALSNSRPQTPSIDLAGWEEVVAGLCEQLFYLNGDSWMCEEESLPDSITIMENTTDWLHEVTGCPCTVRLQHKENRWCIHLKNEALPASVTRATVWGSDHLILRTLFTFLDLNWDALITTLAENREANESI